MNKRNSIVILAKNINMDKEYSNIIDYHEDDLVALCESNEHLVAKQNTYSFLRVGDNVINVGLSYATCLQANYLCMQNPYYSNKWFFAFIDKVEYNSENSTLITYTIDEISTWWDYWSKNKTSFVEREHVNDDTVGLHTIDEGLNTGDYVSNGVDSKLFTDLRFVLQFGGSADNPVPRKATNVNGIINPGSFYICANYNDYVTAIETVDNQVGWEILNTYVIPVDFLDYALSGYWTGKDAPMTIQKTITKQATLDGYTPKNNKCLVYPYNYLLETNNNGGSNIFKYEMFSTTNMVFNINGVSTLGGSIVSIPTNYKEGNETNMLVGGKFPTCAWSTDSYTNWLTQNGVNLPNFKMTATEFGNVQALTKIGTGLVAGAMGGLVTGGSLIAGGVGDILSTFASDYEHRQVPDVYHGNTNAGDYVTASKTNGFYFYKMSVKSEMARAIDDFFTKFGYKVNILKAPNFTGRRYFNYVKIGNGEIIGYSNGTVNIPENSMDIINAVFRRGTTIWHNHDNIGNYNLDNIIE